MKADNYASKFEKLAKKLKLKLKRSEKKGRTYFVFAGGKQNALAVSDTLDAMGGDIKKGFVRETEDELQTFLTFDASKAGAFAKIAETLGISDADLSITDGGRIVVALPRQVAEQIATKIGGFVEDETTTSATVGGFGNMRGATGKKKKKGMRKYGEDELGEDAPAYTDMPEFEKKRRQYNAKMLDDKAGPRWGESTDDVPMVQMKFPVDAAVEFQEAVKFLGVEDSAVQLRGLNGDRTVLVELPEHIARRLADRIGREDVVIAATA